jgi:peptide deformylase
MILDITTFDHPALRTPGARIPAITDRIRSIAADMIETMRDAEGLGLAAQQVGLPLQMFALDVPQMKNRPSAMWVDGQPTDFEALMPLVLINAEVEAFGDTLVEGEGCLSFPELAADIPRPFSVRVKALTIDGSAIEFEADGLLARAIQHELDHTRGVLFIDRAIEEDLSSFPRDIRRLVRQAT